MPVAPHTVSTAIGIPSYEPGSSLRILLNALLLADLPTEGKRQQEDPPSPALPQDFLQASRGDEPKVGAT